MSPGERPALTAVPGPARPAATDAGRSAASGPTTYPAGLPLALDPGVRVHAAGRLLLGGDPGRIVRLGPSGPRVLADLAAGRTDAPAALALARLLVDGGLAHPRPRPAPVDALTVVVPVRDRAAELDRCLGALRAHPPGRAGAAVPVLVVDDGSRDPGTVAAVVRRHGAAVLVLPGNGGPAGARNAGFAAVSTPLVVFVDSDCVPVAGWLEALVGHFADPDVAAVAPRVASRQDVPTLLGRYAGQRGPVDLGRWEGRVRPGTRVPYVPTAALLVRRAALPAVPFEPGLRFGEDVDLVWRLHDAGWTVRYDPRVLVEHVEPDRWSVWLRRRHAYGTSAAPLAERHTGRLAPLVLPPWPTAAYALLLAGRPGAAVVAAAVPAVRLTRRLRRAGLPSRVAARTAARGTGWSVLGVAGGLGGAGAVTSTPVLSTALLTGGRRVRRAAALALLAPPLLEYATARPRFDPVSWTALRLTDDLAYASGVWRSCALRRTTAPLLPRTTRPT